MEKHFTRTITAAILLTISLAVNSQNRTLTLSTFAGTNIAAYEGQERNVSVSRYMFNGWNTLSLPFSLTADEINEIFGEDCKLETLASIDNNGPEIILNFIDCKEEGIKPNSPYILYYSGENGYVKFKTEKSLLTAIQSNITFTDIHGITISFIGAQKKTDGFGLYGIPAKDNKEAKFINVDSYETGFYATRCYISLSSGNSMTLTTKHLDSDVAMSINNIISNNESVDVYSLNGALVAPNMTPNNIGQLKKGIYVAKGKKFYVK